MSLYYVVLAFQLIAFLFAISVHESAHAWMANRCGDPTARMLGRVTLNPIKHIDLFGTIIFPIVCMLMHFPVFGWAKPTPVDPKSFRDPVRDDILTAIIGPTSNFLVAVCATVLLVVIKLTSSFGGEIVSSIAKGNVSAESGSIIVPISLLLYQFLTINVILAVFNLIPLPPLDGSHVIRHLLPEKVLRIYDMVGWVGLLALVYIVPGVLLRLLDPVLSVFQYTLANIKI
jgi:Zn-dependent protease